jgi:hypothetical protein
MEFCELSLTSPESEHEVEGGLLLDVVVGQRASVLKLLSSEDESLLIGRDALLVLDLSLNGLNGVRGLDIKSDGLSGQGLDEDLHSTAESEHEVEGGFLLDVVVGQRASVLKLLSSEDESLLIGRDALLVLDLSFDGFDGVRRLDIEGDGLSGQGFDENLHECAFFNYEFLKSPMTLILFFLINSYILYQLVRNHQNPSICPKICLISS